MNYKFFLKVAIACLVLTFVHFAIATITRRFFEVENLPWHLLSNFLLCLILSMCVGYSALTGRKLVLVTFVISFMIGSFNILIEAFVFNVTSQGETMRAIAEHIVSFAIITLVG